MNAFKGDLMKVFSLTSIATLVKMCTGLVSVKVVAAIIGPPGVALLGQLSNFATLALNFSNGCITSGITKYIAEFRQKDEAVSDYISTGFRITIVCSVICAICMMLFHKWLSVAVLKSANYNYVFLIFGLTIILYAVNNYLLAVVNGYKEFRRYVYISISNNIIGVTLTVILVFTCGLKGALISSVTYQSVVLFITLWILKDAPWFSLKRFSHPFSRIIAHKYAKYALMGVVIVVCSPISQLILRGFVMSEISDTQAGWWEGMNRISSVVLMVITSSLNVYYLPRMSEIANRIELRREIYRTYAFIIPVLIISFLLLFCFRFLVIRILFTPAFYPMSELFIWQIFGDFFKICGSILSFLLIAKAMTRIFIYTEVIFTLLYILLGYWLVKVNGVIGLTQAYSINYAVYLVCLIMFFRRVLFSHDDIKNT